MPSEIFIFVSADGFKCSMFKVSARSFGDAFRFKSYSAYSLILNVWMTFKNIVNVILRLEI